MKPLIPHSLRSDFHAQDSTFKKLFGLEATAKWPKEGLPAITTPQGVKLFVKPLEVLGCKLHRVRAICPHCQMEMSAGRLQQHAKKMHKQMPYKMELEEPRFSITGSGMCGMHYRSDFNYDDIQALDAPEYVPTGSVRGLLQARSRGVPFVYGLTTVHREPV